MGGICAKIANALQGFDHAAAHTDELSYMRNLHTVVGEKLNFISVTILMSNLRRALLASTKMH